MSKPIAVIHLDTVFGVEHKQKVYTQQELDAKTKLYRDEKRCFYVCMCDSAASAPRTSA